MFPDGETRPQVAQGTLRVCAGLGVGNGPRGRDLENSLYLFAQVFLVMSRASFRAAITNWRVWRPQGAALSK